MRIIGHLDMDAFFAAIEERNNPRFAGQPIVVGADPQRGRGRGVVSTANYAAREYGIHSAMPITHAWHLSEQAKAAGRPPAQFLSGGFSHYGTVSKNIMAIIKEHAPTIQKRSIDEAYFDLSHTKSYAQAKEVCQHIKQHIKQQEKLTASIGIGPNKLIAKIASDFEKPDGLTVIKEQEVADFLAPLSIRKIPGIGPKTESRLTRRGIQTVRDLKAVSRHDMSNLMGKWGLVLYAKIRGRDNSPIHEERVAKSIGHNHTFAHDTLSPNVLLTELSDACQRVFNRLTDEDFTTFRTVVITVRFSNFKTSTRSSTLPQSASSHGTLHRQALHLFLPFLDRRENPTHKPIRLIGVRLEKIA